MTKISELPAAAPLAGTEVLPLVQSGETRKVDAAALLYGPVSPEFIDAFWLVATGQDFPSLEQNLDVAVGGGGGNGH